MPRDQFDADAVVDGIRQEQFNHIMSMAEALTEDSDPDKIDRVVNEAAKLPPTGERKIHHTIKQKTKLPYSVLQAAKAQKGDGGDDESDHLALATAIVEAVGPENILGTAAHTWMYDGTIWEPLEPRGERQLVQAHLAEACDRPVNKGLLDSVTDLLKNHIYKPHHRFNVGPADAVPTPNGELVLHDGNWRLEPHCREHYRTTRIPVEYNPTATCPRFMQFLDEVFANDSDKDAKAQIVLELMGYTLMCHTRFEKFVMLVGNGSNGKSVLLRVLMALVGSGNVSGVQPHQMDRTFQRAHLHRKLANIVTEIKQGEVIADAELKGITSGEPSTVENKFKDPFVLSPYATCWFGTNHLPSTRDFSDAIFRRAVVLWFNRNFDEDDAKDVNLESKLLGELSGILNAALAAYANVVATGMFTEPPSSLEAKHQWRLESDQVQQFLEAKCETDPTSWVGSRRLYQAYRDWASGAGIKHTLAEKTFSQRMERLGFPKEKDRSGAKFYGLELDE